MNTLSSRFGNSHVIRANHPLSDEELQQTVPSIYAENAHASRSDRYAHIPTRVLLDALRQEGFQTFMACQARVRENSRQGYAKHMLRLRHASQIDNQEETNEIVLLNSHDGSSSYQMLAGCFRFVCKNGLICGDIYEDIRVQHRGNVVANVIEGAFQVLDNFERVTTSRNDMKALTLSAEEQQSFPTLPPEITCFLPSIPCGYWTFRVFYFS